MPDETPNAATTTEPAVPDSDNDSLPPLEFIPDDNEASSVFIRPNAATTTEPAVPDIDNCSLPPLESIPDGAAAAAAPDDANASRNSTTCFCGVVARLLSVFNRAESITPAATTNTAVGVVAPGLLEFAIHTDSSAVVEQRRH